MKGFTFLLALLFLMIQVQAQTVKIRDITKLEGEHDNPVIGYGLVMGLEGSGDSGDLDKIKAELALLKNFGADSGVTERNITSKNVALVFVQGTLKPYMKPGQKITVKVMSKGSAKSLKNGQLISTMLHHPYLPDKVFALAWGPINVDTNSPNTGTVSAIVEEPIPVSYILEKNGNKYFHLNLLDPSFQNANTIASDINLLYGSSDEGAAEEVTEGAPNLAIALDANTVRVKVPGAFAKDREIEFISEVQKMMLTDYVVEARVLVNQRTGTAIINGQVTMDPVAIAHNDLVVKIIGAGQNPAQAEEKSLANLNAAPNLNELVTSLNTLGVKPADLVIILQKLHRIGSLHAKLEIE